MHQSQSHSMYTVTTMPQRADFL